MVWPRPSSTRAAWIVTNRAGGRLNRAMVRSGQDRRHRQTHQDRRRVRPRGVRFLVNPSALHDELHISQRRDLLRRIAGDDHDVRLVGRRDAADLLAEIHRLGGERCRADDRVHRLLAAVLHPREDSRALWPWPPATASVPIGILMPAASAFLNTSVTSGIPACMNAKPSGGDARIEVFVVMLEVVLQHEADVRVEVDVGVFHRLDRGVIGEDAVVDLRAPRLDRGNDRRRIVRVRSSCGVPALSPRRTPRRAAPA